MCVYDTLATGLCDLSLLEQDKEEITYRWGSIFICICLKAPSCFMFPCVSEDLHTLLYHWKCLKEPNWPQPLLQKYSKIKLHGPFLIWCPITMWFAKLDRHHFHTLPYRQTPTQFFFRRKIASISITISFSKTLLDEQKTLVNKF